MSVRRIALVTTLVTASLSLITSPLLAAAPDTAPPDVGMRVSPASIDSVSVSPWVWEPEASDSLRISVGSRTRRIVIRVWTVAGERRGRFVEQRRAASSAPWRNTTRIELSDADLAGGSIDPDRTRYQRTGFLAFDAASLGVEDHGGLAYSVVVPQGRRFVVRFGARHKSTRAWTTVTRLVWSRDLATHPVAP